MVRCPTCQMTFSAAEGPNDETVALPRTDEQEYQRAELPKRDGEEPGFSSSPQGPASEQGFDETPSGISRSRRRSLPKEVYDEEDDEPTPRHRRRAVRARARSILA